MSSESNLPHFTKIKDLVKSTGKRYNLHVQLLKITFSQNLPQGKPIAVGLIADQTGCIEVQFKNLADHSQLKEGVFLTLVDCELEETLNLSEVRLSITKFFGTLELDFRPKSVKLERYPSQKIMQSLKETASLQKKFEEQKVVYEQIERRGWQSSDEELQSKKDKMKECEQNKRASKKQEERKFINEDEKLKKDVSAKNLVQQVVPMKKNLIQLKKDPLSRYQKNFSLSQSKSKLNSSQSKNTLARPEAHQDMSKNSKNQLSEYSFRQSISESTKSEYFGKKVFLEQESSNKSTISKYESMGNQIEIHKEILILQKERTKLAKLIPSHRMADALQITSKIMDIEDAINQLRLKLIRSDFVQDQEIFFELQKDMKINSRGTIKKCEDQTNQDDPLKGVFIEKPDEAKQTGFLNKIKGIFRKSQNQSNNQVNLNPNEAFTKAKPFMPKSKIMALETLDLQKLTQSEPFYFKRQIKIEGETIKNRVKIYSQIDPQQEPESGNKYNFKSINLESVWDLIQKAALSNPEISHLICDEMMNEPVSTQNAQQSEKLKDQLKSLSQKFPESLSQVIVCIAEMLERSEVPVILSKKSTTKSKLSMRTLTGEFMENAAKITQKIPDNDPDCTYTFDDLYDNDKFDNFCRYYKQRVHNQTSIDPERIFITCVSKGSIVVEWITDKINSFMELIGARPALKNKYKIHKFFKEFHLSLQDFDQKGDIKFFDKKDHVEVRGGWPYYQPIKCKRFGISVSQKYDNKDDTWLGMKNRAGEWAVAFHGVQAPKSFLTVEQRQKRKVLNLIMDGLGSDKMLKAGRRQAHSQVKTINKGGEKMGVGVYCTPHIQETFRYVDDQDKWGLIFQCRVNPKEVRVSEKKEVYWVIGETSNIRPYGIILIKKDVRKKYPSVEEQFKEKFKYERFRKEVERHVRVTDEEKGRRVGQSA